MIHIELIYEIKFPDPPWEALFFLPQILENTNCLTVYTVHGLGGGGGVDARQGTLNIIGSYVTK